MENMEEVDVVIIGSGPAGYSAAIYTSRANLKTVLFEGFLSGISGGQLMTTTLVENFPGFPEGIMGPELMNDMKVQSQRVGTKTLPEDVKSVDLSSYPFVINGSKSKLKAKSLIIATGSNAKRLDILGSDEFWQKGVSSCAVCDGAAPVFRGKELFVIGGGDSAVEEAVFLTKFASKVYMVNRKGVLRASKIMVEKAINHPKIEILFNSEIIKILGDKLVSSVVIKNNKIQKEETKEAAGVFFAIGHTPNTAFLNSQVELNEFGYISVEKGSCVTSKEGVFAAGDVQDYIYQQAVVAAGSGCMAALNAEKWLESKKSY
jgi:thioredoxin reductase (NADPH)